MSPSKLNFYFFFFFKQKTAYEMAFLQSTGIERADAVLAVTGDDEDNLVALQLAKKHFNVPLTIARVNNPANVEIFKALGVDEAVSATEILLKALEPAAGELQGPGR